MKKNDPFASLFTNPLLSGKSEDVYYYQKEGWSKPRKVSKQEYNRLKAQRRRKR